ncbi:hypothetical protein J2129_002725 [Methanofollis sp. W23]|uniref:hypothetical protein n=1 Tax=Methanofollis sp. W23 TaxID=2817849 RepID=UPI001AE860DE|nr:hypothetical protein [Methanofollis sp. W23]MBP2147212.1 hypothetical protein [Methanofollis sp. W23]
MTEVYQIAIPGTGRGALDGMTPFDEQKFKDTVTFARVTDCYGKVHTYRLPTALATTRGGYDECRPLTPEEESATKLEFAPVYEACPPWGWSPDGWETAVVHQLSSPNCGKICGWCALLTAPLPQGDVVGFAYLCEEGSWLKDTVVLHREG